MHCRSQSPNENLHNNFLDSVSSIIDILESAEIFIFGDFSVHNMVWLESTMTDVQHSQIV